MHRVSSEDTIFGVTLSSAQLGFSAGIHPRSSQFSFLALSRELRDIVYDALLVSSPAPPSSPDEVSPRMSAHDAHITSSKEERNHYPAAGPESTTASLQLTCRQIHEELAEAILRLERCGKLHHKLDIMVVDD